MVRVFWKVDEAEEVVDEEEEVLETELVDDELRALSQSSRSAGGEGWR